VGTRVGKAVGNLEPTQATLVSVNLDDCGSVHCDSDSDTRGMLAWRLVTVVRCRESPTSMALSRGLWSVRSWEWWWGAWSDARSANPRVSCSHRCWKADCSQEQPTRVPRAFNLAYREGMAVGSLLGRRDGVVVGSLRTTSMKRILGAIDRRRVRCATWVSGLTAWGRW
jgi:hypothetical protein